MADKDDKASKDEKPAVKKDKPARKHNPLNEASWSAFGTVLLAGFGVIVTAMGGASLFEPGLGTAVSLLGGLGIFTLSAWFAKIAITEFGRAIAETLRANAAVKETEDEK